jgi:ATPase subunit of ABC transporter with duplicated ATPase domains
VPTALQKPDILLLDEPTNHLDAETVGWLEQHLQKYEGTVIAVTHDRYFLDNVAGWILELDRGEGIPWKGNYSSWLEQKQNRLKGEEKTEDKRRKTLERELEWIRMSPKGRHAKSKARITQYEELASQESEKRSEDLEIYIPVGERLGDIVVEALRWRKVTTTNCFLKISNSVAARRNRRRHRRERRGQNDFVSPDYQTGNAGRGRFPSRRKRQTRLR